MLITAGAGLGSTLVRSAGWMTLNSPKEKPTMFLSDAGDSFDICIWKIYVLAFQSEFMRINQHPYFYFFI